MSLETETRSKVGSQCYRPALIITRATRGSMSAATKMAWRFVQAGHDRQVARSARKIGTRQLEGLRSNTRGEELD